MAKWCVAVLVLVFVSALVAAPARAGDDDRQREKILEGLKHGIAALKALGRHEDARHLAEILEDVAREGRERRERAEGHDPERMEHAIEVLRLAMKAFTKAEKRDAAERVEWAVHALKVQLEGRRDEEAREILERAPRHGELAELLRWAGKLWRHEFGDAKRAEFCEELAREIAGEREEREGNREREIAERHLEIMRIGVHGLLEKDQKDMAHRLEQAVHALELRLEGRRDEEAQRIYERAPRAGELAELLMCAARNWDEFGHERKAAALKELAGHLAKKARGERERERERRGEGDDRIRKLERAMAEMMGQMERLARELEELKRELR